LLAGAACVRGLGRRRCDRKRQRDDQEHQAGEYRQRRLPTEIVDQRHAKRSEHELTERACRGTRAEREPTPLDRQQFAEGRQHEIERTARQAEANQYAGAKIERERRCRIAHQHQPSCIEQGAHDHHTQQAEPVRDSAGHWLAEPPE
jgi:hypothetical protein